jgi:predicted PurR-regulated permease PerM
VTQAGEWLTEQLPHLIEPDSELRQQITELGPGCRPAGGELLNTLLSYGVGVLNGLLIVIVVPVVTFYLLLDWDHMVARIDDLLPRQHAPTIRRLARECDETLAAFIRGQALVCLILGTFYAAALAAVGLSFGLVVGAIAGVLTFIPYVGALVGGLLAIGLALYQFWGDWVWVVVVWAIFQGGQFVEGNFLTPKLVGERVGVHPVWLLFALAAFAALFGFLGVLVAVPVAAVIGVLVRFAVAKYKEAASTRAGPRRPCHERRPARSLHRIAPLTDDQFDFFGTGDWPEKPRRAPRATAPALDAEQLFFDWTLPVALGPEDFFVSSPTPTPMP